ncbi:Ankyrin repeat protein [Giardia duodenalis]|uniref:Ankyrin repeat protein n=1 Tax=Giardia intestinalis TaxID=5741 RepID=V6TM62_GIAIN|nr:Ankyrin repeat protein [Giardia intestinalis]
MLVGEERGLQDKNNQTALMIAGEEDYARAASLLVPYEKDRIGSEGKTALVIAAEAGHETVVEAIDPTDENGITALMRAVNRNDVGAVKALLPIQRGRKTYKEVTISGWYMRTGTALMMAAAHGYAEIVELLAEHEKGEKVGSWAALVFAARCNRSNDPLVDYSKCVELLMEYESSISGWTELIYAAARGHEEIVELLKQEARMKNNEHQTALMWAARNDHPECVRLLLKDEGGMQTTKGGPLL